MRTDRAGLFIREVCNAYQLMLTVGNDLKVSLFVCLSVCLSVCLFKSICIFILYSEKLDCLHLIGSISKSIIPHTKINDDKTHYIIAIYALL